ncbi:MAG: hypothetical protein ACTSYQ_02245 [Candidatus Odinarchaeia archaeon]
MNFKIDNKNLEEENPVLIHTELLKDIRCGVCNSYLTIKVYSIRGKIKREICCEKCNANASINKKFER